jgi:alkanesulfonate monooxygenase SsuD/methylene tetrahydromethanopterin reductase-like flavin-dependent oxidoreductase (luciferase family)
VAGVSANSETLVLAGERGYIPMSINFVPPRILRTHWEAVATGAARAGRPADRATWRIARDVYVADTDAQARREALSGPLARDYRDYFLGLREVVWVNPVTFRCEHTVRSPAACR